MPRHRRRMRGGPDFAGPEPFPSRERAFHDGPEPFPPGDREWAEFDEPRFPRPGRARAGPGPGPVEPPTAATRPPPASSWTQVAAAEAMAKERAEAARAAEMAAKDAVLKAQADAEEAAKAARAEEAAAARAEEESKKLEKLDEEAKKLEQAAIAARERVIAYGQCSAADAPEDLEPNMPPGAAPGPPGLGAPGNYGYSWSRARAIRLDGRR